ncbi:MAG TPA: hypothetical protein VK638_45135 [Edaphobacter sp.]|nr:hypothetical protein [Edaphobacter sp.]
MKSLSLEGVGRRLLYDLALTTTSQFAPSYAMSKPGGASPAPTQFDMGSGGGELGCLYKGPRAFPNPPVTVGCDLMPGGVRDATPSASLQLIQLLPASSSRPITPLASFRDVGIPMSTDMIPI